MIIVYNTFHWVSVLVISSTWLLCITLSIGCQSWLYLQHDYCVLHFPLGVSLGYIFNMIIVYNTFHCVSVLVISSTWLLCITLSTACQSWLYLQHDYCVLHFPLRVSLGYIFNMIIVYNTFHCVSVLVISSTWLLCITLSIACQSWLYLQHDYCV